MVEKWNCKSRVVAPRIFIPDLPRRVRTPPWPPFPRASPARSHAHATCFSYATPMARYRNFSRGDRRRIPTREKERKKFTRRRLRGAWMQRRDVLGRRSVRPGAAGDSYVAQPPAGAHLSHHRCVRVAPFVPRPRRSGRRSSAAPRLPGTPSLPAAHSLRPTRTAMHIYTLSGTRKCLFFACVQASVSAEAVTHAALALEAAATARRRRRRPRGR